MKTLIAVILILVIASSVLATGWIPPTRGTITYASPSTIRHLHATQWVCAVPILPKNIMSGCGWAYSRWPWQRFKIGQSIIMYDLVCLSDGQCSYGYALAVRGK